MNGENPILPPKPPGSSRLILTLGLAGFLAGIVLVGVYSYTQPMIEANRAKALERALFSVLPASSRFQPFTKSGAGLKPAGDGEKGDLVYAGLDSLGALTGFAIPGDEPGYQDVISALFGYDPTRKKVIGLVILESKETPGLGDKIFKDPDFQANFSDLIVDPEVLVVSRGEKKNKNEVEAISGATISSKAVVRLINKALEDWKYSIDQYVEQMEGT